MVLRQEWMSSVENSQGCIGAVSCEPEGSATHAIGCAARTIRGSAQNTVNGLLSADLQWCYPTWARTEKEVTAMDGNTDDKWLTRQELADRYGLPVKTPAEWASKGTGPRYANSVGMSGTA